MTSAFLDLKKEIVELKDKRRAVKSQGFFKTGKGEYGEGDVFLGLTVPQSRKLAIKYKNLQFSEIKKLLKSKFHEERLIALLILVNNFNLGNEKEQKKIFDFYLENTKYINNWDLVDLSADKIVGGYLFNLSGLTHSFNDFSKPSGNTSLSYKNKSKSPATRFYKNDSKNMVKRSFREVSHPILNKLAKSKNLWERRISMIATFYFIKNNKYDEALKIAEILLFDEHDLIQKAVGWMLREVGKRDLEKEIGFLNKYCKKMPRTALRYAIEKFPESLRRKYLGA